MEDKKIYPKFKTRFLSGRVPNDPKIEKLKYWCKEFGKKGLTPSYGSGSFGNMSFRVRGNKFIITASGIKDPSSRESFVTVSSVALNKKMVYAHGKRPPSSESMLHYVIYRKRKDVNAIFHGHYGKILRYSRELSLPSTLKNEPYGTIELAKRVLDILDDHDFLIMKDHGFISLGKDMDKAGGQVLRIYKKLGQSA